MTDVKRPERLPSEILSNGLWVQHFMAKNAHGKEVPADSADAVCWCLTGACLAAHHGETLRGFYDAVYEAVKRRTSGIYGYPMSITKRLMHWNDCPGRTKAEVVEVRREAEARYYGSSS